MYFQLVPKYCISGEKTISGGSEKIYMTGNLYSQILYILRSHISIHSELLLLHCSPSVSLDPQLAPTNPDQMSTQPREDVQQRNSAPTEIRSSISRSGDVSTSLTDNCQTTLCFVHRNDSLYRCSCCCTTLYLRSTRDSVVVVVVVSVIISVIICFRDYMSIEGICDYNYVSFKFV